MKTNYVVISLPENGDAEVVWFIGAQTPETAREEAIKYSKARDEKVLLAQILETVYA